MLWYTSVGAAESGRGRSNSINRSGCKASFPEVHETDELCFVAKVGAN